MSANQYFAYVRISEKFKYIGQIEIKTTIPKDGRLLAFGDKKALKEEMMVAGRLDYSGKFALVNGIPEAQSFKEAEEAYFKFLEWLKLREDNRKKRGETAKFEVYKREEILAVTG